MGAAAGEDLFVTPKPTGLLERMIQISADRDSLVLDFFAGSGTTGDAVLRSNRADGGTRRFVLVQLPEPMPSAALPTLAALTRERMRKAIAKISEGEGEGAHRTGDLGFRSFHLQPSNFTVWSSSATSNSEVEEQLTMAVDHVTPGAAGPSMLAELLLKAGYPLTSSVDEMSFAGVMGHSVADGALLVCLSRALTIEAFEAMVDLEPAMILVLDAGFGGSDELKVNALQTVRARNQRRGSDIALKVV
jgi:adenine-specific DNA-methyltransferase